MKVNSLHVINTRTKGRGPWSSDKITACELFKKKFGFGLLERDLDHLSLVTYTSLNNNNMEN